MSGETAPADVEMGPTGSTEKTEEEKPKPPTDRKITFKTASDAPRDPSANLTCFPANIQGAAPMSWQRYIFVLFEHPEACTASKYISAFVFLLIFLSSVSAWIETIPKYEYPRNYNTLVNDYDQACTEGMKSDSTTAQQRQCKYPVFWIISDVCMAIFLFEYMVRLLTVSGPDVSPWNDIELVWPREQRKDQRGQPAFDENNRAIYDTPDDNAYNGFRHPEFAADAPRMSGLNKTYYWVMKPLSIIDLLAVLPFIFQITGLASSLEGMISLRYFRLVRIFRVLKLQKQTIAVALFVNTIKLSAGPLMVLMFFVMMAIVVFGSVVYQVESGSYCPPSRDGNPDDSIIFQAVVPSAGFSNVTFTTGSVQNARRAAWIASGEQNKCQTILLNDGSGVMSPPDTCCTSTEKGCYCVIDSMGDGVQESAFFSTFISMWWVLTTITTVGYGDMFPTTLEGRIVGALAMILGVVGFAMPISIIGTAFEEEYHRLAQNAGSIDKMLVDHAATSSKEKAKDGYPIIPEGEARDASEGESLFKTLIEACIAAGYDPRELADFCNQVEQDQNKSGA